MPELKFPDGFLWGAATSAHQIEGNNHNDWSEWEQSEDRVGELKKRWIRSRDFISSSEERVKNSDFAQRPSEEETQYVNSFISGQACDSYNRYEEDFDIAKSLNHNVHRFSIEWSRIEPEKGKFSDEEMRHYKTLIGAIRSRGMEPMVTLWHFTNPTWFSEEGGFLNKKATQYFTRYVKYVVDNLKDDVRLWITFNESDDVYAAMAYYKGTWPPEKRSMLKAVKVVLSIMKCHKLSYKVIHQAYLLSPADNGELDNKNLELNEEKKKQQYRDMSHNIGQGIFVGIVENNRHFIAGKPWGKIQQSVVEYFRNRFFLARILPFVDFIGLNYYTIDRLLGSRQILPVQEKMTEMNWEIYPEGIYHELTALSKFKKPIYITENGIADRTDQKREKFIKDHLFWIHKAISEGVDVRGYMYWSLLDNFEWAEGYGPRFGLVEMNYDTMERKIRPSAWKYAEICKANSMIYD